MSKPIPKRTFNTGMMADDMRLMPNHRCYRPDQEMDSSKSDNNLQDIPVTISPTDPCTVLAERSFVPSSARLFVNGICYFGDSLTFPDGVPAVQIPGLPLDPLDDIRLLAIPV